MAERTATARTLAFTAPAPVRRPVAAELPPPRPTPPMPASPPPVERAQSDAILGRTIGLRPPTRFGSEASAEGDRRGIQIYPGGVTPQQAAEWSQTNSPYDRESQGSDRAADERTRQIREAMRERGTLGGYETPVPSAPKVQPAPPHAGTPGAAGAPGASGTVNVRLHGAPPGTTTSTVSATGGLRIEQVPLGNAP